MCELLFILQRISVTILFYLIMFMISVLSVYCCALLNFESFIHGPFCFFNNFFLNCILFNMFLFCLFCFLFGLLVPLNGIKKYLA